MLLIEIVTYILNGRGLGDRIANQYNTILEGSHQMLFQAYPKNIDMHRGAQRDRQTALKCWDLII